MKQLRFLVFSGLLFSLPIVAGESAPPTLVEEGIPVEEGQGAAAEPAQEAPKAEEAPKEEASKKESKESEEEEKVTPIKKGNLKLGASQSPAYLFSFGQNFYDKGDTLLYLSPTSLHGDNERFADIAFTLVRQVTDKFSLRFNVPVAVRFRENCSCSAGIEDISLQGEYAFFDHPWLCAYNFATAVGAIIFPTGSDKKNPPTGNGSVSFFFGMTMVHESWDWYVYAAPGVTLTTKHHGTKLGDTLLYTFGVGHNIPTGPKWIAAWLVEAVGEYTGVDIIDCVRDCESGSNIISIAPSLWASTEKWIFQLGVAVPVVQHIPLLSNKERFVVSGTIGYKF